MESPELDLLIKSIKPVLKASGFKKTNLTWHKELSGVILVFNIQKSQWGPEFYLNLAIYLKVLGSESKPPESRCHILARLDHSEKSVEDLLKDVFDWFKRYGSISNLRELAKEDKLPHTTVLKAKEFFAKNC